MTWCAIVVAAGRGTRFGRPKQLLEIAGVPMLLWPVRTFSSMSQIGEIVVVTEAEWRDEVEQLAAGCTTIAGGATRQASVYEGLKRVPQHCEAVFVHDGARPMITRELVLRGMEPVEPGHASLLATPVIDTIKVAGDSRIVTQTPDRTTLWAAQTPQFATTAEMRRAHEAGIRDGIDATDDAMLLERAGVTVHIVPASPDNFKVTLPEDLERARQMMAARV